MDSKYIKRLEKKIHKCKNIEKKQILEAYLDDIIKYDINTAKRNKSINKAKIRRKRILTGNLVKVSIAICMPIAIYGMFNSFYNLLDSIISSAISASSVTTVSALSQVKNALSAFGAGVAGGGAIIVARNFGAGKLDEAKKNCGALFSIILMVSALVICILIPLSKVIIQLAGVADASSDTILYFRLQLFELAIVAVNSMFIGLEKAKGNSKHVFFLNLIVLGVKLSLNLLFVYYFKVQSIVYIEVATIIGQLVLLVIGLKLMFSNKNILKMSVKNFTLNGKYIKPILKLSIPIFFGKFVMSLGKVVVNSLCGAFYNASTDGLIVGALAVSNNLSGLVTTPTNAFEEGESTIVSQNLGARNMKRALKAFWVNLGIICCISLTGFILVRFVFLNQLVDMFNYSGSTDGMTEAEIAIEVAKSQQLVRYIKEVFKYDCITIIVLGLNAAVLGLLYGFGQTYLSSILNFSRIGTRILTLIICYYVFEMDYTAAGISMGISNTVILTISTSFLIYFISKLKKNGYKGMKLTDPEPEFNELKI